MSQKITAQEGPTITLEAADAAVFVDKEDHLVSLSAASKVVLFDGTAPAIGTFVSRLSPEDTALNVRLLNAPGTARMIQNAAITPGAQVAGVAANARVATAGAGDRSLGIKIAPPAAGAAGDVIEVITFVENLPLPPEEP
ncbi:hypothetical protein OpiT1DRAFT_03976 [Opitutaceae bacterium TAV1]|nr:hypothetical protein OpiT1DRAFT_03976 [Opitutaceae bacterium TAV1]